MKVEMVFPFAKTYPLSNFDASVSKKYTMQKVVLQQKNSPEFSTFGVKITDLYHSKFMADFQYCDNIVNMNCSAQR